MEVDEEVAVTSKKKVDKSESVDESKLEGKKGERKSDGEDPKPRIVLTFRSEKPGAKSSAMKIVTSEEKQEEVSLRRSNRTRKWDSDEDTDGVSPKKDRKDVENEDASDSSHTPPKRSTRRRSKEFDNVIANAIARKEKYNETPVPTRPSRRIKPTAKVLANEELRIGFESQNSARLAVNNDKSDEGVKTRRSGRSNRHVVVEEEKKGVKEKEEEDVEENDDSKVMKLKHLCELGLKAINTENEDSQEGEDEESEAIEVEDDCAEDEEIDDDTEVINQLLEADAESFSDSDYEFLSTEGHRPRRSTRLHSSYGANDSDRSSPAPAGDDDNAPLRRSSRHRKQMRSWDDEPAPADEGSEAARPSDESSTVGTCCCETPSNIYADPSELNEPVFCQAVELVDGVRVGCSHSAAKQKDGSYSALVRAGPRAPYFLACTLHTSQLRKHMCCSTCGLFCTQGIFYQCSIGHLFHVDCGLPYNDSKPPPGCPHCGVRSYRWQPANRDTCRVKVRMNCSNKRIFLPDQREQCTPAYLGFSNPDPTKLDHQPVIPEDLLPLPTLDLKQLCEKPDIDDDPLEAIEVLCEGILAGETAEQLIPKIISCIKLNLPVTSLDGFTCAHAAAKKGHLQALHLLQTAGADVNALANSKTPLMVAILELLDKSESRSPKKTKSNLEKETEEMEVDEESPLDKDGDKEEVKRASETERASDEDLMRVIRYLVAVGCDLDVPGPDGMTAVHLAAHLGGGEVLRALRGADIDARDQGGWTPLVWAAENNHPHCVQILLEEGADASSVDSEGNSIVHWCSLAGSSAALQLLLNAAPHEVNALNAHTDTPLHVAARQGHYACVVVLLARGARTDLENSAGELPADVCKGQCHSAISLNMQMTLALTDKLTRRKLLSSDISKGREEHPIPCFNEVDDTPLPEDFTYVTSHVMPRVITIDYTIENSKGCECKGDDCSASTCECCVLGVRSWWARGRLAKQFPYHDPPMLFECNQTCGCHAKKCTNSVITRLTNKGSVFIKAMVFRRGGGRGWGLRAAGRVARGAPVATYVGELLAMGDADTRANDQYMFALDVKTDLLEQCVDKTQLCVDAAQYGGAARFINHSCRPNLAPVRVFTTTRDLRLPTVTLFAAKDIASGQELTFDYGDKFWSVKSKWMRCECGSADCRYPTTTEDNEA